MKAVKQEQTKIKFDAFIRSLGLNYYKHTKFYAAYADCVPENVECDGMERNLDFFNTEFVDGAELLKMTAYIGSYNWFGEEQVKKVIEAFGDDAKYSIGREGSPVIYVKPSHRVWLSGNRAADLTKLADEVSFEANLGMFRIWFD